MISGIIQFITKQLFISRLFSQQFQHKQAPLVFITLVTCNINSPDNNTFVHVYKVDTYNMRLTVFLQSI